MCKVIELCSTKNRKKWRCLTRKLPLTNIDPREICLRGTPSFDRRFTTESDPKNEELSRFFNKNNKTLKIVLHFPLFLLLLVVMQSSIYLGIIYLDEVQDIRMIEDLGGSLATQYFLVPFRSTEVKVLKIQSHQMSVIIGNTFWGMSKWV